MDLKWIFSFFLSDCPKNCEKCSNRFSCSTCDNGYALLKRFIFSRCVQKCPRGYKKVMNREGGSKCVEGTFSNLVFQFQLKWDIYQKFWSYFTFLNLLIPKVSLVVILTACPAIPMMSHLIGDFVNGSINYPLIEILFLRSHTWLLDIEVLL